MLDFDTEQLRGAALAYRAADTQTRTLVRAAVRDAGLPVWRQQITYHYTARQDHRLMGRPSVQMSTVPTLTAYTGGPLSGGLSKQQWWAVEFGSAGRHGRSGQLPRRRKTGRLAYAALPAVVRVVTSAWVRGVYDAYGRAGDGQV